MAPFVPLKKMVTRPKCNSGKVVLDHGPQVLISKKSCCGLYSLAMLILLHSRVKCNDSHYNFAYKMTKSKTFSHQDLDFIVILMSYEK